MDDSGFQQLLQVLSRSVNILRGDWSVLEWTGIRQFDLVFNFVMLGKNLRNAVD